MYRAIKSRISDSYRRNRDDLRALARRIYPEFVFKKIDILPKGQIPVFAFHSVEPSRFELQLRFLVDNNYNTISADSLCEIVTGKKPPEQNTVVLTFDDGRASLWSTAYPLLKKYGLTGVSFIVAGAVPDNPNRYPNLEDLWVRRASPRDIELREAHTPLCSWKEIEIMQKSGVIDFQSHTTYHNSVFINDKLIDFINPSFVPSFLRGTFYPAILRDGCDVLLSESEWGRPVYKFGAAMAAHTRYLEDERLSHHCIDFVKTNGGTAFFQRKGWRRRLIHCAKEFERKNGNKGRFQSRDERYANIVQDLAHSKKIMEKKLDTGVRHLCYPWYFGSDLAIAASKAAGFVSNHWGILKTRAINTVGDDPFYIARMAEDYVYSLPGRRRMTLPVLLLDKVNRLLSRKGFPSPEAGLETEAT